VTSQKSEGLNYTAVEAWNPNITDCPILRRETQQNPELLNTLKASSLYGSRFNASHPTKVIIHGFAGGRHLSPSTDLRDGMLAVRDKLSNCKPTPIARLWQSRAGILMSKVILSKNCYRLKIEFFWDVMPWQLVNNYWPFEVSYCRHLQYQAVKPIDMA
jgi:hypothetical protein